MSTIYWREDLALLAKTQEAKIPRIDALARRLGVGPGMSVLDIGAGTGQAAYRLSTLVGGAGRVVAAEIDATLVEYVRLQARARGLANVDTALIGESELAGDYGDQRYDLILIYDTLHYVLEPVKFLARLRSSLAPGGRVVLVGFMGLPPAFAREDFRDWSGFLDDLRGEPPETPFGRELRGPLESLLAGAHDSPRLERAALFHMNRLLQSAFFERFLAGGELRSGLSWTSEEKPMADWSLGRLRLAGLPGERTLYQITFSELHALRALNKLLLIERFRSRLAAESPQPYASASIESSWYAEHDPLRFLLDKAGYRFEAEHPMPPFQAARVAKSA